MNRKISKLSLIPLVLFSSGVFADSLTIRFLKPIPSLISTSAWTSNVQNCSPGSAIWGYNGLNPTAATPIASDSPNYGLTSQMEWGFSSPTLKSVCIPLSQGEVASLPIPPYSATQKTLTFYNYPESPEQSIVMTQLGLVNGPNYFNYEGNSYYFQKCADFDNTSIVCCFTTQGDQCDSPPF